MATKVSAVTDTDETAPATDEGAKKATATPRKIPGNLPYHNAPGTLKKALDGIVEAASPPKFNADFLENVLKIKGGSGRAIIPIFKRIGLVAGDGTPTELYNRFRTGSGRGQAALTALRTGFAEIFKRSEYAHSVPDAKLKDIITEITGLKSSDGVAVAIRGTFNAIKSYIPDNLDISASGQDPAPSSDEGLQYTTPRPDHAATHSKGDGKLGLVYNINIVLPETSDLRVLNAIFRSLKENLLQ